MSSKKIKEINTINNKEESNEQINDQLNEGVNQLNINEDTETIQAPKKKKVVSEATKAALAKGREKLNKKWEEDRIKNKELEEKYAIKKANKIIKHKMNIKKKYDINESDTEDEEPVKIIQKSKPKKQVIIFPAPESDEEEIIMKKAPKKKQEAPPPQQQQQQPQKQNFNIMFY
jgi:hypothetical protein